MKELELQIKAWKFFKKYYPSAWIYKTSDKWVSGIPDFIICYKGKFVAIELKTESKVSKIQQYTIKRIKRAEGYTFVCRSVEEIKEAMEGLG